MKTNTPIVSLPRADSSLDATLNPVELPTKEVVSWGVAFPRSGSRTRRRVPMWRPDATIGTVLGLAGRMTAAQTADPASTGPGERQRG
jgi:hypothetical protein